MKKIRGETLSYWERKREKGKEGNFPVAKGGNHAP